MFFCALSGEAPQDPVVSAKSGHVYERRLIIKYLTENGKDPITGERLEESDLISIKANPNTAPPKLPAQSSIPALLHTLQNEWDALVLETFQLRQQYNSTRQELSYALYAQDAATRVVARLLKERDASREALGNIQATMDVAPAATTGDVEMDQDDTEKEGLPAELVNQIDELRNSLTAARKKRKAPAGYATLADVKQYASKHTIPSLHSPSPAGINALALSRSTPSHFLTGGNDNVVQLYDRNTDKVLATLKGHSKAVTHVALRERDGEPTQILSGSADKNAKVWSHDSASGDYVPTSTIRTHKGGITGLAVHPISTLLALASSDKTYSLHDLTNNSQIFRSKPSEEPFTSLFIHPDAILMGLGTPSSTVYIFDIRTGELAGSCVPANTAPFTVNSLCFSENGYHLAAPDSLTSVGIWDLRKNKIVHSFDMGDDFRLKKLSYDATGNFLGIAGNNGVQVFAYKTWEELANFGEAGDVADIAFGESGKEVWAASGREVRIWGMPA